MNTNTSISKLLQKDIHYETPYIGREWQLPADAELSSPSVHLTQDGGWIWRDTL